MMIKQTKALGIYGGASLNYAELAIIDTDGLDVFEVQKSRQMVYPEHITRGIRAVICRRDISFNSIEQDEQIADLQSQLSDFYVQLVVNVLEKEQNIGIIGVDGLTIYANKQEKCSYQLEKGHDLSRKLQRRVVTHFHKSDILAGGVAAPLSPAFLAAIGQKMEKPCLFVNIEAVCSLVYLSENGEMIAFDCAPGMAMIEDWTFRRANMLTDYNGKAAALGKVHQQIVQILLRDKMLKNCPPKALDVRCFADKKEHLQGLSLEDGAATASFFIAQAVKNAAIEYLPELPKHIYILGEGAKNPTLSRMIKQAFGSVQVENFADVYAFNNCIGAQVCAFNAVRRLHSLPISFPKTTGVSEPMTGGEIYDEK